MIEYIDRMTGKREIEKVAGEKSLKWVYESPIGMSVLELFVKRKLFNYLYGKIQDSKISKKKIENFISEFEINETEFKIPKDMYENFNDFFARELKKEARSIDEENENIVSPADGRILAYNSIEDTKLIQVKGEYYDLKELLVKEELIEKYKNCSCFVVRLCPTDYHRFHFPDSGVAEAAEKINGTYYSVNPIALNKKSRIYCRNKREVTIFHSDNFEDICIIEVGATCVGSIIQTYSPFHKVQKGEEKGYFKFGGSTVIMLIQNGIIDIDKDLIQNTKEGLETKVQMGMKIGKKIHREV
jgi:phosphatidylserine decarboxylase